MTTRRRSSRAVLLMVGLAAVATVAGLARAEDVGLTFFGWSDQHVQANGDGKHLLPAIEAMNALPGTKYPPEIGGTVAKPAFVLGCGDITDWPTVAAKNTFDELITRNLHFPGYNVVGNHDEGGDSPSETIKKWIVQPHGALSYTFNCGGVHFVVLFSKYDESLKSPAQPLSREALEFLRKDLAGLAKGTPVIVAMHLCFDAITNRDELVDALGNANVILVLGGHYHKAKVDHFRGVNFLQLPSPAPNGAHEVTVIRVTSDRLVAVPYHYENKAWSDNRSRILDAPIRGSAQSPPAGPSNKTYQVRYLPTATIRPHGRADGPDWSKAQVEKGFAFPWKQAAAPLTEFRALCDDRYLYFSFRVHDADIVALDKLRDKEDAVFEDRVEMYFSRDDQMRDYYCIEIDSRGRVFDYRGSYYRRLDPKWNWPGLETKASAVEHGYAVEGRVPLSSFEALGFPRLRPGVKIRCGLYRAEFSHDRSGRPVVQRETLHNRGRTLDGPPPLEDWLSWVDPKTKEPDFHVPSSLGWLEFPARPAGFEPATSGLEIRCSIP